MLLAIDPGADTGWAHFDDDKRLIGCGLGEPALTPDSVLDLSEVVIECEELRGRSEANPNSILLMARNAGQWFGQFKRQHPRYIRVADWKGRTPKDIDHRRTFKILTPPEVLALVLGCKGLSPRSAPINEAIATGLTKADKRGNVLDAIGIGLWAVGRK